MIGERLKEERLRLNFTQPVLAEVAGAKKRTLIDWEKGVSSPNAQQLELMGQAGLDVLYVVTGKRSSVAIDADPDINELISLYRKAPLAVKHAVIGALTAGVTPSAGGMSVKGNNNTVVGGNRIAGRDYHEK